jgi:hypothetical protein
MLFGEEADWKELLDGKAQVELAELIEKARQHRSAYMQADDVKVAQLWAAITEISMDLKAIGESLDKLEIFAKGFTKIGEIAKREAIKDKVSDLVKPKTSREREEVEKIVDTLMEF